MRIPTVLAAALASGLWLAAPLARADAPPDGAEKLKLYEGESKQIGARNGSQVTCDDPSVAHGEVVDERFLIVAGHPGQTLCGVRFNGVPGGIYLVTVEAKREKK